MKFILSLISAILFFNQALFAQSRMKNTKSPSELLKQTNPPAINAVGKIEGNEVKRGQVSRQPQTNQKLYIEPTPDWDESDFIDDEFLPGQGGEAANSGIEEFN